MGLRRALGLTRKSSTTTKLKATADLAVSRSAVLKNQRKARASIVRSDVVQLLKMGNQDTALIRVEQLIRLQNTLDALSVLDGYCNLLIESVNLIENEKSCPDELLEAISTLIFASARLGDFPELLEIRSLFSAYYGKEFISRAVELRNNCGVTPKFVQMLSTRMPSLENRKKMLKKIADEENIELQFENTDSSNPETENQRMMKQEEQVPTPRTGRKYKDVADAAQEAFESAAYAAAAARAAMELSRAAGGGGDPGGHDEDDKGNRKVGESSNSSEISENLDVNRRPVSVRTRSFQGS